MQANISGYGMANRPDHQKPQRANISFHDHLETNPNFVRFEVFPAATMENVVFWDIKTLFVLHRRHITSPLQSPAS
jgi:hypothetical protein